MKKYVIIAPLLLLCACLQAQEITISTGAQANFFSALFLKFTPGGDMTTLTHFGGFGSYVDLTYIRCSMFFSFFLGGVQTDDYGTHDIEDAAISFLNLNLLGKYPFDLGAVNIWPAAGILYTYCIDFEIPDMGPGPMDESGFRDIHILIGVGLDFKTENMVISPHLLVAYNLMPYFEENPPSDVESYQLSFMLGVSVGYIIK
jgi:hypothetical protein